MIMWTFTPGTECAYIPVYLCVRTRVKCTRAHMCMQGILACVFCVCFCVHMVVEGRRQLVEVDNSSGIGSTWGQKMLRGGRN
jgi:hypothetical protein